MGRTSSLNPFAFVPLQVTLIGSASYVALFAVLLYLHLLVPSAPSSPTPSLGINLTTAWHDLQNITAGYHPWGSRRNDEVREYLNARIVEILDASGASFDVVYDSGNGYLREKRGSLDAQVQEQERAALAVKDPRVVLFANDTSNITTLDDWFKRPWTQYVESTNILVYIRGTDDTPGDWWNTTDLSQPYNGRGGVLVNAHFDSVSTGYGATDDGVGVVTILQLISHFSQAENQPKRGIVALLNNGEENGLFGARAFMRHPLSRLPRTFLNLEGAGAGGRAMLFRSTDAEVSRMYAKSPRPFGNVVSGDGFKNGFVASGTDYTVFTQDLGLRGLDVAFFEPRARYHTDRDDARDTCIDSLWHMLSASLETMRQLTSYQGDEFEGLPDEKGRLSLSPGSDAVWFDVFGRAFAVLKLHTLFALSVSLLVAGPVILIILEIILRRNERWYLLAHKKYLHSADDDDFVRLHGRRGFTRFPIAVIFATAAVIALAYLLTKINPYIMYSSQYAVWAMMLSAWISVAWFFFAGSANIRPTALHRAFALIWLYAGSWIALVLTTIGENNLHIGSGYFLVIMNASVWLALFISYLEMFALPSKTKYTEQVMSVQISDSSSIRPGSQSSRRLLDRPHDDGASQAPGDASEADERTSLLHGNTPRTAQTFTGYGNQRRRRQPRNQDEMTNASYESHIPQTVYTDEQAWSASLPQWTWIVQFLILVPINVILIGQLALLLTSALHQTPADGNPVLAPYLFIAILTLLLLLPMTPFLHRFTYHIPTFLFFIFIGCLLYNTLAFPFSRDARMKFYFAQQVNLDTGANNVSIIGLDGYVQQIAHALPSTAGQHIHCISPPTDPFLPTRKGLTTCTWPGLAPNLVPSKAPKKWLSHTIKSHNSSSATFTFHARASKQYRLLFPPDQPISSLDIPDSSPSDPRIPKIPATGATHVFFLPREWDKTFNLTVSWPATAHSTPIRRSGRLVAIWADAEAEIPALEEIRRFAPVWSTVTQASNGLVEGWREWEF